jgi:hypothetical protein
VTGLRRQRSGDSVAVGPPHIHIGGCQEECTLAFLCTACGVTWCLITDARPVQLISGELTSVRSGMPFTNLLIWTTTAWHTRRAL